MIPRKDAHQLTNILQMIVGHLELGNMEQVKQYVRELADYLKQNTEKEPTTDES